MGSTHQNAISRKSYHSNKARVARRRILLAIASGKCVLEKTLMDENNFYKWTPAEEKVLQSCIDKRRNSYLTLPQAEQIADKRYLRRIDVPDGRANRYQIVRDSNTPRTSLSPISNVSPPEVIIEDIPFDDLNEQVQLSETVDEYKERFRHGKLVKRPESLSNDEAHLQWNPTEHEFRIPVELMTELYHSLYESGKRKIKNNNRQKKINSGIYHRLFKLMEIDDLLIVYMQPNKALQFIKANAKYISMTPFVHLIVTFIFHLEKGNFDEYISKHPNLCWLYRLTLESVRHNVEKKVCVVQDSETIVQNKSLLLLRNELKERQSNDMKATSSRLGKEPYFDWQSICKLPELITDKNLSMKTATYRVLLVLYTREFVARDDYGSLLVYTLKATNIKIRNEFLEKNAFLQKRSRNVIIRVDGESLVEVRKHYSTIDENDYFKYKPNRSVYTPTYYNKSDKMNTHEFRYILYLMYHKTYEGFKVPPIILTDITSDYIEQLLEYRTEHVIPLLPSIENDTNNEDMYLFVKDQDKKPYAEPWKLGPLVTRMFGELTGTHISINDLRHSFATYFRSSHEGSETEITILRASNRMFHTLKTHVAFYTHTSQTVYTYLSKQTEYINKFVKQNKLDSEKLQKGQPYMKYSNKSSDLKVHSDLYIFYLKTFDNTIITNRRANILHVSESEYIEGDSNTNCVVMTTQTDVSGQPLNRILQIIKIQIDGHRSPENITDSTIYSKYNEKSRLLLLKNVVININKNVSSSKYHNSCKQKLDKHIKLKQGNRTSNLNDLITWRTNIDEEVFEEKLECMRNLSYKMSRLYLMEISRIIRIFSKKKRTNENDSYTSLFPTQLKLVKLVLNDMSLDIPEQFALVPVNRLKDNSESMDERAFPTMSSSLKSQRTMMDEIRYISFKDIQRIQFQTSDVIEKTKESRKLNRTKYCHYSPILYREKNRNIINKYKQKQLVNERVLNNIYPIKNDVREEVAVTRNGIVNNNVYNIVTNSTNQSLSFFNSVKTFVKSEGGQHDEILNNTSGQLKTLLLQFVKEKESNADGRELTMNCLSGNNLCIDSIHNTKVIQLFCERFGVNIKTWSDTDERWTSYTCSTCPTSSVTILMRVFIS